MADIETLKLRLWNDARADKWEAFNEDYEALLEKTHNDWLKAIEDGDAPN